METVAKLKQYGGTTGDVKKIVLHGVDRIVGINISYEDAINSLTVFYRLSGRLGSTGHWGTADGRHREEIRLNENECIVSLSGHYGSHGNHRVIRSLTLVTNRGTTYGPYGTQQGTSFELSWNRCPIVGFHALCGVTLNAIGAYVKVNYNAITPGNGGARGCRRQKRITCGCRKSVWVLCDRPWYHLCGCGASTWRGCGPSAFYQCRCGSLIWKGCERADMTICSCGRARLQ